MDIQEIKLRLLELVVENIDRVAFDLEDDMHTDVDAIIEKANELYKGFIL